MASTDARPVPRKNTAFRLYTEFRDITGALITGGISTPDTEISGDGGSFADATNEFTEIGSSGVGYIDLTSGEMDYDSVVVKATCANADAVATVVYLYPEEVGDIRVSETTLTGIGETVATIATDVAAIPTADDNRDAVWGKTRAELSAPPAVSDPILDHVQWVFLQSRNKREQTATTATLRNAADNANIATASVSDDGTTFTIGAWS